MATASVTLKLTPDEFRVLRRALDTAWTANNEAIKAMSPGECVDQHQLALLRKTL